MPTALKMLILTLLITICSTAHSSSSDDWKIWQTIEIELLVKRLFTLYKSLCFLGADPHVKEAYGVIFHSIQAVKSNKM
ncbi:MAG: hypothetical protein ACPHZD_05655 [Porticoccaceae bacterium]